MLQTFDYFDASLVKFQDGVKERLHYSHKHILEYELGVKV